MNAHLQPSGSAYFLAAETRKPERQTVARVIGLVLAAMLGAASAVSAGELIPAIGTDVWLVAPEGFEPVVAPAEGFALNNEAGGVVIVSQAMARGPVQFDLDELAADPAKLEQMGVMFANGKAEIISAGANRFLLIGGDIPAGAGASGNVWLATAGEEPVVTFTFAQIDLGDAPALDRAVIEQVLASVVVSPSGETDAGINLGGLSLPAIAPFSFKELTDFGFARLRTSADSTAKGLPRVTLFFAQPDKELLTLDQIANKWLGAGDDASLVASAEVELVGVPALRQEWTAKVGDTQSKSVGYVAVVGGQRLVLALDGAPDRITAEIISKFDQIAGALAPGEKPE